MGLEQNYKDLKQNHKNLCTDAEMLENKAEANEKAECTTST